MGRLDFLEILEGVYKKNEYEIKIWESGNIIILLNEMTRRVYIKEIAGKVGPVGISGDNILWNI